VTKLKIGILSYRSAPFGGGQGIYVRDISQALLSLGHSVDVISGDPYPQLSPNVKLIKLPGLNLFETFNFKDRLKKFLNNPKSLANTQEFISTLFGGFPEMRSLERGLINSCLIIMSTISSLIINLLVMES
jgi:hypothetical protein